MARPLDPNAKRNVVTTRVDDDTKGWLELWRPHSEASTYQSAGLPIVHIPVEREYNPARLLETITPYLHT